MLIDAVKLCKAFRRETAFLRKIRDHFSQTVISFFEGYVILPTIIGHRVKCLYSVSQFSFLRAT